MDEDDRQFLFTAAWLFARHGQAHRARLLLEALVEANPEDGVAAVALAERLLDDDDAEGALAVLLAAEVPSELSRAEALLECRALAMLGRKEESAQRWNRYIASSQGAKRNWVSE